MLIFGHRGAAGYEPENTLRSFQKAIDLGVQMIECDVRVCKTGELVIMHDTTVDRTTNGKGTVAEKTFDELRTLDAGKGERIPTLDEVMDLSIHKVKLNIELKGDYTGGPVAQRVTERIRSAGWRPEDLLVSSFHRLELKSFMAANLRVPIAVITLHPLVDLSRLVALNAYSVHAWEKFITRSFVERTHAKGMQFYAWTVNEPERAAELAEMGVDGIFSDFPDRVRISP